MNRTILPDITRSVYAKRTIIFFGALLLHYSISAQDPRATLQKFTSAYQLVNMAYVDSVDQPKLIENAIIGMLKELDPHSVYMNKSEVQRANEPLMGNFEGIGVQFQIFKDTIVVIAAIAGGPSEKVGIMAGDKIIRIDGQESTGPKINNNYVMERLRGKKGTKVNVSVYRQGSPEILDFTITRDKIPLNSIDATFMLTPETGYIRLNRFSRTTMEEFHQSMKQLRDQGMENLILDLRGNSGGFLDVAVDLADEFLDNNKMIVYTEGLRSPRQDFRSSPRGSFHDGRLIVLINEGSASASEIVSGAVQDWDRGVVMGRRSFGKGLVQRQFTLPDSSMIRLTTSRYYTPSGRCIQKPYDEGVSEYQKEIKKRLEHGEMVYADSIRFPDSLKYFTSNKRIVYGGGGIMPDIFLPVDTTGSSDYYSKLIRRGVFNSFTMEYLNTHRSALAKKYPTLENFIEHFETNDAFIEEFVAHAGKEGVKADPDGLNTSGEIIRIVLKASIARNLFDINAYYKITSSIDTELQKAVQVMNDKAAFNKVLVSK